MISQFLILNVRGDTIIFRDFRQEKSLSENLAKIQDVFYKKIKQGNNEEPTTIYFEEQIYIYLRQSGLFFVLTSYYDVSPTYIIELLYRIIKLVRDFCGTVNEDSIRRNFILVYELIDEIIDFGYPQIVNTNQLKYCVYNETKVLSSENFNRRNDIFGTNQILGLTNTVSGGLSMLPIGILPTSSGKGIQNHGNSLNSTSNFNGPKTISSNASQRPINPMSTVSNNSAESKVMTFLGNAAPCFDRNNEVFVDIFERISLVLNHLGEISRFNIEGGILMKSYLIGQPELTLGFSNNIILKEDDELNFSEPSNLLKDGSSTIIDDCNFHESVNVNEFLNDKVLTLKPPEGEIIVMNYRISKGALKVPFKFTTLIEVSGDAKRISSKFDFVIKLKVDIPETSFATNLTMVCPLPEKTNTVSLETIHPLVPIQQSSQYDDKCQRIIWKIKKIHGGTEVALKSKLSFSFETDSISIRKIVGPLFLNFEIPMFNLSNIQVKYLKISEKNGQQNNYRWVRYVTQSNSYIYRLF
ncbi:clathrin coat assembly protein AP50 [Cryptosporidium ubiquitum]|uniref:Clathrin coat assembly protein AP50 n=1 Tax=Cryptosporidium ubiquitum TaxID=857276 RepID=A0A1J4MEC4_9CRYT|nr:clathrin coat assembly protein AP50 [Cryptosporidium ubiquitum]OII72584.1 clathrin coat assembly protein AP50 [Cryptosporidium ubiquitum]